MEGAFKDVGPRRCRCLASWAALRQSASLSAAWALRCMGAWRLGWRPTTQPKSQTLTNSPTAHIKAIKQWAATNKSSNLFMRISVCVCFPFFFWALQEWTLRPDSDTPTGVDEYGFGSKPKNPLVNIKVGGKWMFAPKVEP